MLQRIVFREFEESNLPDWGQLGEPFYTTDTHKIYFGQGHGKPLKLLEDLVHIIQNDGVPLPQRQLLNFIGNVRAEDDEENNTTNVYIENGTGSGSSEAKTVFIDDVDQLFSSDNVEDALKELFISVSSGKDLIAAAITDKGVEAGGSDPFDVLSTKIYRIEQSSQISRTKINVVAPYLYEIPYPNGTPVELVVSNLLTFTEDDARITQYVSSYDNGDRTSFIYNPEFVDFDGYMRLKERYKHPFTQIGDHLYEVTLPISKYQTVSRMTLADDHVEIRSTPFAQVIKASGDIFLYGVKSLEEIKWTVDTVNNGTSLLALSFDKGETYHAYNSEEWIDVDIDDLHDFATKGMTKEIVNELTNSDLDAIRGTHNSIRFAYYLDQPTLDDIAMNDSIELIVTMEGHNLIADSNDYSCFYDPIQSKLIYEIKKDGTYTFQHLKREVT